MAKRIWVAAYNHDYNEWSLAFADPRLAVIDAAREFDCTPNLSDGATSEFWDQLNMAYENGDWKGFTLHEIDLDTLEARKLGPTDLVYTLAELAEVDPDFEENPAPTA